MRQEINLLSKLPRGKRNVNARAEAKTDELHLLDRYRVDVVVWARSTPLSALLASSPAWHRVHHDALDDVWVRAG